MASGTRTVLISRWRVGGQTAFDLMREFAQELPHTTPADAWQRSVLVSSARTLDAEAEPRVKKLSGDAAAPTAENPFFWAGYMLVDSGQLAASEEPPPAPVLNFQKKLAAAAAQGGKPLAPPVAPGPVQQPPAAEAPMPAKVPALPGPKGDPADDAPAEGKKKPAAKGPAKTPKLPKSTAS